jgi:phasin family protein
MTTANEGFEMFNDLGSKGYESARQLGELNLRAMEKLVTRQMDAVNLVMESGLRQVQLATEAKGYSDLVKGQLELAKELGERVMEESRSNVKLASDTRDEYRVWFEQNVKTVSEKMAKVQPVA